MANVKEMPTSMAQEAAAAVETLRRGGVILYPTDTIWGIGCDAYNKDAIKRVYQIKRRADSKALITLVSDLAMLERHVEMVPEVAYQLLEVATRPLTIIYDHGRGVATELLAPDGSIGIRLTADPFCQRLCKALRRPIVSTSANISGQAAPASFAEISPEIIAEVDYVVGLRHDEATDAAPSSVVKLSDNGEIKILRP
ncbi:MAG: threonylcarbamoyl-AMP synthase [Bacteroidales bacterium]|nr:threonylcarbamoyl-AMP synthase [Bacteroidales bacterium]